MTIFNSNPFKQGTWMHEAWQEGYNSPVNAQNPYLEDTALTEQWYEGQAARKIDEFILLEI